MIDRYCLPEMQKIWSEKNKYATWFRVETAICNAMAKYDKIPKEAAEAIKSFVNDDIVDEERILEIESEVMHDVIAFLTYMKEILGDHSKWLHFGVTSSDIVDTAFAIRLRASLDIILSKIDKFQ